MRFLASWADRRAAAAEHAGFYFFWSSTPHVGLFYIRSDPHLQVCFYTYISCCIYTGRDVCDRAAASVHAPR